MHALVPLLFLIASPCGEPPPARAAGADVQLSALFGDHMVAQCGRPLRAWGTAPAGTALMVTLYIADTSRSTAWHYDAQADESGEWSVEIEAQPPGGPYRLMVDTQQGPAESIQDLWFGDVWICSGQSNMEWPLSETSEAEAELAAGERPLLRLFQVPRRTSDEPLSSPDGEWRLCTPEHAAAFSGVGYHFGRALSERTARKVGLIQSAWGGTPAEAWTERSFLEADEELRAILDRPPRNAAWGPAALFNGMIAPLSGLELAGVIWYQGESNADRAWQYRALFPAVIRSWRWAFEREDLPFLFVQLANFQQRAAQPGESAWAELREAQALALSLERTGMAVAIDVGEADDIHPRDKRTVGERLALAARSVAYGEKLESCGPTFRALQVEGGRARVSFDHAAGLRTRDGAAPAGFALAGEDRSFRWAQAAIEGEAVVLSSEEVPAPVAVRFAWADNPAHNLANGAGLPAIPFRSDDWPLSTRGNR